MPPIIDSYLNQVPEMIVQNILNTGLFNDYKFFDYLVSQGTLYQNTTPDSGAIRVVFRPNTQLIYGFGLDGDSNRRIESKIEITITIMKATDGAYESIAEQADRQIQSDLNRIEQIFMNSNYSLYNSMHDNAGQLQWKIDPIEIESLTWYKEEENDIQESRVGKIVLRCGIIPSAI